MIGHHVPDIDDTMIRVPVIDEVVTVDKIAVTTDAVRVITSVEERSVLVEDVVERGALRIERFAMDRQVDIAPAPREEGDTSIVSLVEERLVVEKRLFVIEEIHVTSERTQEHVSVPVTLRTMRASVERPGFDVSADPISTHAATTGHDSHG